MRIVFSDMDGTFLDNEKCIPAENLAALDMLAERGDMFVPCSGRVLSGIPEELLRHPATGYAVCSSGATVYKIEHPAGKPWEAHEELQFEVAREDALRLYEQLADCDMQFDVFADGCAWSSRALFEHLDEFDLEPGFRAFVKGNRTAVDETVPEILARVQRIERINMYYKDADTRARMERAIEGIDGLYHQTSCEINVEACCEGATKGDAAAWVCDQSGVDLADAIAFGDAGNDLTMLERCGTGVAMANATPECLAVADVVAPSNDEAGFARAVERLLVRMNNQSGSAS